MEKLRNNLKYNICDNLGVYTKFDLWNKIRSNICDNIGVNIGSNIQSNLFIQAPTSPHVQSFIKQQIQNQLWKT